jgi:glycosyltransferase involved in cell wall biosynthesis
MKILMICEGITKYSIIAQPWKHVFELSRRMIRYGNDVQLLTNSADEKAVYDEISGVPIIRVKKGKFFFANKQLLKHLNDEKFDVINWHGSDAWSTFHAWRLRKKLKNNIVWTLHSGPLSLSDIRNLKFTELPALTGFWNNVLNAFCPSFVLKKWMCLPQIKGIITLSQRLKMYLVRNGIKEDKVIVIRSGVDTEKYYPLTKNKMAGNKNLLKFNKDSKVILYFGHPSPFRGLDTLIMAMQEVKKSCPFVELFLLVRETGEKIKWLKKAADKMKEVLIVEGVLNDEILISYLSLADIVVLPFRFWPQVECPLTVLEAMAMGKAVITTYTGAIPEIILNGKNGVLVPPNDSKKLANAIVNLLRNPSRIWEIGYAARNYIKRFHDWDVIVKDTLYAFSKFME